VLDYRNDVSDRQSPYIIKPRDVVQALSRRLVELVGDEYAINQDKPRPDGDTTYWDTRCLYYTHNDKHYDETPSAWIGVTAEGQLTSNCWVCKRRQVVETKDVGWDIAPTLLTLSRKDQKLLAVLVWLGCKEVFDVNGAMRPAVAFPVTYADGSTGYHYRVALEGKDKWVHLKGGKASQAVFGLHMEKVLEDIQKKRVVIVTESPMDACVLLAAGFPAIAVLGKNYTRALAYNLHKETLLKAIGDTGTVYVWQEPDATDFAQQVANALRVTVKVITPPEDAKDAYRLWVAREKDWDEVEDIVRKLLERATEIAPQPEPAPHGTQELLRSAPEWTPQATTEPERGKRYLAAVWKTLAEITKPAHNVWQVEGLIKPGNLILLSARPKTGKSIVALNLAASVASGTPFLDRSVRQGRALFVAFERHDLTVQRAWEMGLAECRDFMLWDKHAWGLPRVEALDFWLEFIEKHDVTLFIVDTLAHFLRPELELVRNAINAYDYIYAVMEKLQAGASDTGCTFLLIHHDRKGEGDTDEQRVLGTTALTAAVDAVFQLKPVGDGVICLKATGNAFDDTTFFFTIGEDKGMELAEKPATTKEERAARAIEDYLRQHSEATRQQLIDHLREVGLAESRGTAGKLVDRALQDRLMTGVEKEHRGRESVYRWKGGSWTSETFIGNVPGVHRRIVDIVDNRDIVDNGHDVHDVHGWQRWTLWTNPIGVSDVSNPEPDPQAEPDSPDHDPKGDGNPGIPKNMAELAEYEDKPLQNLALSTLPHENGLWQTWQSPETVRVCQVCQTQNTLAETLAETQVPVKSSTYNHLCQDCQGFDVSEAAHPEGDHSCNIEPGSPERMSRIEPDGTVVLSWDGKTETVSPTDLADWRPIKDVSDVRSPDEPMVDTSNTEATADGSGSPVEAPRDADPDVGPTPARMTERLADGSVRLLWDGKTEIVAPGDLAGWRDVGDIPNVELPSVEGVEIPPTIVLDIETDGLKPENGEILAVGVALSINGKDVETRIFRDGKEADRITQAFEWLKGVSRECGPVIVTGYNIFEFDLKFLIKRAHMLGVPCLFHYEWDQATGKIKSRHVAATAGTLKGDPLEYPIITCDDDVLATIIDTLHLVCRWDYTAKQLRRYDLKSVAAHFGVAEPNRPILSPDEILYASKYDRATFDAYVLADLRETYAVFEKLIKPYAGIAAVTGLRLDGVVTRSTAWVWEQILERYYTPHIPQPDEKRTYEGGLVVSRKGLWFPCLKLDIASLYPTIMLAYRIHSRKDPDQVALRWLKTLTEHRLALKAKAKKGDERAHILQDALKILINSLYGFYGTGGYGFNDMSAAEKVTEKGREILTSMIAAVEEAGGIVVEADTDGIIVCTPTAKPEHIVRAASAAIPEVFKVEVEWRDAICFVSDDKNYIVVPKDGDPIMKGSKWRGRDKEPYLTQAIPTFVRLWATEGEQAAMRFANTVQDEILRGHGWRWIVRERRVGKNDTFLLRAGFRVGESATYAYVDKKQGKVARDPKEGYDRAYYARRFAETVQEVIAAIRATEKRSDNVCHNPILSDGPPSWTFLDTGGHNFGGGPFEREL